MAKKKFHVDYSEEMPEFTLDDIMKEFGSGEDAPTRSPDEILAQAAPEAELPRDGVSAEPEQPEPPAEPVDYGPDVIPFTPMPLNEEPVPAKSEPEPAQDPAAAEEIPAPEAGEQDALPADQAAPDTEAAQPAEKAPADEEAPSDEEDVHIFTPKKAPVCTDETVRLDADAVAALAGFTASDAPMEGETIRIDTGAVNAMTGETVRLDTDAVRAMADSAEKTDAALEGETVRVDYDRVNAMTAETRRIDTEAVAAAAEAQPPVPSGSSEGAEPFSEGWEPQYEEPIGEYVPPQPIVFRPRSRLQELKKKLVAGPERRYYALIEEGVGKLQAALLVSVLIVILSAVSVGLNQMHLVQPHRMRLLVFGEVFAMLFCALLSLDLIISGLGAIARGRFTVHSLLAISFFVCFIDSLYCLRGVRVPYGAAFCLETTAALWAEYQRRSTETGQMDTLRKATHLNRIAKAPGCCEEQDGFYLADGEVEDFMDSYNRRSQPEKALNTYALIAFLASTAIGILAFVSSHVLGHGLQMWAAALLASTPATIFLTQSRPMAILERRLHRFGVVLCGWQGALNACGSAVITLTDHDLFPEGSVKINGVKAFSSRHDPDELIAYTAALLEQSGTVLAPLFTEMRDSRYGRHYSVENPRIYEAGGLSGVIEGNTVLVGTLDFLKRMGVRIPENTAVETGVYTAVGGELCSLCAMAFGKLKGVSAGLAALCSQRSLQPLMITGNFLLSERFLQEKFGIAAGRVRFPTGAPRRQAALWQPDPEQTRVCCLSTQESIAATGFAISGARSLVSSVRIGTTMHILGGIVGLALVLILQFVDGGSMLTAASLLMFQLIWSIPGLLITEWTRSL